MWSWEFKAKILDLGRVWEGFGEDLGRKKERKKREKKRVKKGRKKERSEREGDLNYGFPLFGATCIRGDCLGSLPF